MKTYFSVEQKKLINDGNSYSFRFTKDAVWDHCFQTISDKYCEKCVFCSFFNLCHTKFSNRKIGFLSTLISEANIFVRFSNEEEISIFYSCKMTYFYIRMFSSQNPALYIILSLDVGMKNVEKKNTGKHVVLKI